MMMKTALALWMISLTGANTHAAELSAKLKAAIPCYDEHTLDVPEGIMTYKTSGDYHFVRLNKGSNRI